MNPDRERKKKLWFIINPKSGHGMNKKLFRLIGKTFPESHFEFEIKMTERSRHAVGISEEAVKNLSDAVIVAGGDGTINEAAQPLRNTPVALGIIPSGSGNGFANYFKIPHDVRSALEVVRTGKTKTIDSITVNNRFCINLAGTGFDAYIAFLFSKKKKRGFTTYIKLVIQKYFGYDERVYRIELNGTLLDRRALLISLANGNQFGNGAKIAPHALADDGLMDVVIMKKNSWWNIPMVINSLFADRFIADSFAELHQTRSVIISGSEPMYLHLDGEPEGPFEKIEAQIHPMTNKIIVP